MAIEIKAPTFPESVADGTVATWHKQPGDAVKRDELLVDIETDKVVMEVLAEADGVMGDIAKAEGDTVLSGEVLGVLKDGEAASALPRRKSRRQKRLRLPSKAVVKSRCCRRPHASWLKKTAWLPPTSLAPAKVVASPRKTF